MTLVPGAAVKVLHPHPRTGAVGWLPGTVCRLMASGRIEVQLTVEGKPLVVWTEPSKVRLA